jgi:hypothetical protein
VRRMRRKRNREQASIIISVSMRNPLQIVQVFADTALDNALLNFKNTFYRLLLIYGVCTRRSLIPLSVHVYALLPPSGELSELIIPLAELPAAAGATAAAAPEATQDLSSMVKLG